MEVGKFLSINRCQYRQPLLPLCMALYSEGTTFHKPTERSASIQAVLQVWDGPGAVIASRGTF